MCHLHALMLCLILFDFSTFLSCSLSSLLSSCLSSWPSTSSSTMWWKMKLMARRKDRTIGEKIVSRRGKWRSRRESNTTCAHLTSHVSSPCAHVVFDSLRLLHFPLLLTIFSPIVLSFLLAINFIFHHIVEDEVDGQEERQDDRREDSEQERKVEKSKRIKHNMSAWR